MTQHTKERWVSSKIANNYDQYMVCEERTGRTIATGIDGEATALLIAELPDLLSALEAFLRAPSVGSNGPGSITIEVQSFNRRAAYAAINKATGRCFTGEACETCRKAP